MNTSTPTSPAPTDAASIAPDLDALHAARQRLAGQAHVTPVFTSSQLDARCGAQLFLKTENLQKVGAFKFRGAFNTISSLPEVERRRGVVTHSSGNHAQAVALAAHLHGCPAHIVMPSNAPEVKRQAVLGYGAEVIPCEPTHTAREQTAQAVLERTGGVLVHPYDDGRIVAGQGTVAMELLEQAGPLDVLLVPVGGGGLSSGCALAAHFLSPSTRVIGCEPEGADDAARSLAGGTLVPQTSPDTICDGLRGNLGRLPFSILKTHLADLVTVSDDAVVDAMRLIFERLKLVVEPSAAITLAALLSGRVQAEGQRVGVVLSGGNLDLGQLPWQA